MASNVIWIDANIDNVENSKYISELKTIGSLRLRLFKNVDKAIQHMKFIDFNETKVIISGRLYSEFVQSFKENIIDMCVAPKIIIFTGSKEKFIEYNKNYQNASNIFYTFGGIATSFNEIKNFLQNDKGIKKVNNPDEIQLTFEYRKISSPFIF